MPENLATTTELHAAHDDPDPVSPELVLIDPELAERAREAMPSLTRATARSSDLRLVVAEPSRRRHRNRLRRPVLVYVAAFVLVGSVGAGSAWLLRQRETPTATPGRTEAVQDGTPGRVPTPPRPEPLAPPHFTWAPVRGAESYRLALYRAGLRVYEVVTKATRHALPLRWTFAGKPHRLTPGTYRWVVVPRLGEPGSLRDGDPIVNSSYTV